MNMWSVLAVGIAIGGSLIVFIFMALRMCIV